MQLRRNIGRVAQLIRYHRPSQFGWRLWRRAQGMLERSGLDGRRRPKPAAGFKPGAERVLRKMAELRATLWPCRADKQRLAEMAAGRFSFLNEPRDLARGQGAALRINWSPDNSQLWRFHLQCQEYLVELAIHRSPADAWQLVKSWLAEPAHLRPHAGVDAWHPFCISRRLPVWLMLAAFVLPGAKHAKDFWESIANQTDWLRRHLEWDLGGNHLLENLRALALVHWLVDGVGVVNCEWLTMQIREQLSEQILPSGEHCERAATYHALMQLAVLEIARACEFSEQPLLAECAASAERMADFLAAVAHPDGQIPLWGDSALDETPSPTPLCGATAVALSATGNGASRRGDYWCWRSNERDFLIVDAGPMACDHLPAHAHGDLLTLEASLRGQRVFVDGGVFDYENSEMRRYCRGTAAHNTLQVDGEDHADTWSRFRMGRRGRPTSIQSGHQPPYYWFAATHDAYAFRGVPSTGRFVAAAPGPVWIILDWISATGTHGIVSRLRLHPDVKLDRRGDTDVQLGIRSSCSEQVAAVGGETTVREYRLSLMGGAELVAEQGWYCPCFGERKVIDVIAGRSHCRDRQWLAWLLQPVEMAESVLEVAFGRKAFEVRLPSGCAVMLPWTA